MTFTRRQFIHCGLATAAAIALPGVAKNSVENRPAGEVWLSAQGKAAFGLAWIDGTGNRAVKLATGLRGHQVMAVSESQLLMVSRRPGRELLLANLAEQTIARRVYCPHNRVLAGHACLSPDGKLVFTTEADERDGSGFIGIYSADNLQRLGEFSSHGIGPHQLALMPDGKKLVVANGGLHTRAATGRQVLNLNTMDSSLVYLNRDNGELLEKRRLAEKKAGIRHLDVNQNGDVVIAMQLQRKAMNHHRVVPLGARHRCGEEIVYFHAPETLWASMNDYGGSVCVNSRYGIAGITSPRGNIAGFWHTASGELAAYHALHDVCGIAVSSNQENFVLSNSRGQLRVLAANNLQEILSRRRHFEGYYWDNHLSVMEI